MSNATTPAVPIPTPAPPPTAPLEAALLAAQKAVRAATHDARNAHHGYSYASAETILIEAKAALNAQGLAVTGGGYECHELAGTVFCRRSIELRHAASGQVMATSIDYPVCPDKGRPMDKALAGVLTTSMAYYLRDLLLMPRVEGEVAGHDDRGYRPSAPANRGPAPASRPANPARPAPANPAKGPANRPANAEPRDFRHALNDAFRARGFPADGMIACVEEYVQSCGGGALDTITADQQLELLRQVRTGAADGYKKARAMG